jgi:hypothetical protein
MDRDISFFSDMDNLDIATRVQFDTKRKYVVFAGKGHEELGLRLQALDVRIYYLYLLRF